MLQASCFLNDPYTVGTQLTLSVICVAARCVLRCKQVICRLCSASERSSKDALHSCKMSLTSWLGIMDVRQSHKRCAHFTTVYDGEGLHNCEVPYLIWRWESTPQC